MATWTGSALAELTWRAPATCPTAAQVSSEVERLLRGSQYPREALSEFSLLVTHDARAGVFSVRITRTRGQARQERIVAASDCRELMQAAALAVALAINPEL